MKFDYLSRHGFYLPASLPVSCSCRECDGGKIIRKAAMKNIGHSAAVVCGTKSCKTDRYPPFGGAWVCSVGGVSCMELTKETQDRHVKSSARSCRGLHGCASARSDWPAKQCGQSRRLRNSRPHLGNPFEPALTSSPATGSRPADRSRRSWPKSPSGRSVRRHDVAASCKTAGVHVAHRVSDACSSCSRQGRLLGLAAADEHVLPKLINVDRFAVEVREPRRCRLRRAASQGQQRQNHQFPHPHALQRGARLSGMPV